MPTLVVSPRQTQDSIAILKAAEKAGWGTHRALRFKVPDNLTDPVLYGDLNFCAVMADLLKVPLIDPLDDWLATLPEKYLHRQVWADTLGNLPRYTSRAFYKPANDKVFPAGIYEQGGYVPTRHINAEAPVLISEIVDFQIEIRCYLRGRELLTAGLYISPDYHHPTAEIAAHIGAQKWVQHLLEDPEVEFPPASTLDVGYIPDVGWAVVEINQAYSSGIYMRGEGLGADPDKILPVLLAATPSVVSEAQSRYIRSA